MAKGARADLIGSRGARAFLVRGSRLPGALIFSASRPIKHCTQRCARRCWRAPRGAGSRHLSLRSLMRVWSAAERILCTGDVAAIEFYETLTTAQPNSDGRCVSRLQTSTSSLRPLPSLSDPVGEPDLHLTFRRAVRFGCPPARQAEHPACVPVLRPSRLFCPDRSSFVCPRKPRPQQPGPWHCRTSSAAASWLKIEPLPWIHAAAVAALDWTASCVLTTPARPHTRYDATMRKRWGPPHGHTAAADRLTVRHFVLLCAAKTQFFFASIQGLSVHVASPSRHD